MVKKTILNTDNIIEVSETKGLFYNKGIGEVIFEKLTENRDLPFQVDGLTGHVDTYGSVLKKSVRAAIKMRSQGVSKDDIISICTHNHLDTNIPLIASLLIGAKCAALEPSLSPSDTAHLLNLVKPKFVFVSRNAVKLIENAVKECEVNSRIVSFGESFTKFCSESPEEEKRFLPVKIDNLKETASIWFSSGSTGLPKGVCINHLTLLRQLLTVFEIFRKEDIEDATSFNTLYYSSPYWISSFKMLLNTIVLNGCRVVTPIFEVDQFWEMVDKYKVFFATLAPSQLVAVANSRPPKCKDTTNLKSIAAPGSPMLKENIDKIKQHLPTTNIITAYGQTETAGLSIGFDLRNGDSKYLLQKPTSCGRPKEGFIYKITDLQTGKPLGPNQNGELMIKTEYCMNGYLNADSSSEFDDDGFLKTGDLMYYDDDYCFYFVDRIKDVLKYQNWQIAPAKLEAILSSHPEVAKAIVIGLPHPNDGDLPTGIVQLKRSSSKTIAEEIQKYYDERIDDDKHRLRGGLKIVDKIPLTPSGKPKRLHMRNLILSGNL